MFVAVSKIVIPKLQEFEGQKILRPLSYRGKLAYLKTSAALPYWPCNTSGAKYSLSPSRSNPPRDTAISAPWVASATGLGHREAIPKSPILKRPSLVTKTLEGFRSRCMTPESWINLKPYRKKNTRENAIQKKE